MRALRSTNSLKEDVDDVNEGDLLLAAGSIELTGITRLAEGFRDLDRAERLLPGVAGDRGVLNPRPRRLWRAIGKLIHTYRNRGGRTRWTRQAEAASEMEGPEIPLIASLHGSDTRVLVRLQRDNVRVRPTRLEGQALLLLKITRVLKREDVVEAADLFPGARGLGESFRQGLEAGDAETDLLGRMTICYPGLVGTAIAVYER